MKWGWGRDGVVVAAAEDVQKAATSKVYMEIYLLIFTHILYTCMCTLLYAYAYTNRDVCIIFSTIYIYRVRICIYVYIEHEYMSSSR